MAEHGFFGPQTYTDDLWRLVGAFGFLIQWLYVLLVFHDLSSVIQAS
jgi:hypothetical protein